MLSNESLTLEKLQEAMNKIQEPEEEVHVNIQTYNAVVEKLGFKPSNLILNRYIPENQAVVMNREKMKFTLSHRSDY